MSEQNRIIWADFIRVSATFMVVWLHSAAPLLPEYNKIPVSDWWTGNIYYVAVRAGVPLFFMLSGSLLIGKTEPLNLFFIKRMSKVLLPLIAWSIVYLFWTAYYEKSTSLSFGSFYSILIRPAYSHMWFMYAITILYLHIPVLRIFAEASSNRQLYYFVLFWFLITLLIPFAGQTTLSTGTAAVGLAKLSDFTAYLFLGFLLVMIREYWRSVALYLVVTIVLILFFYILIIRQAAEFTGLTGSINLNSMSGFTGYLVLGYLLGKVRVSRKLVYSSVVVLICCAAVTAYGNYFIALKEGKFIIRLNHLLNANIILLSASAFLFLKAVAEKLSFLTSMRGISIMEPLSSTCLGIYLIHPIVLNLLKDGILGFSLSALHGNPVYSVPITALTCYLLSFSTIHLLQRIPFVKRIAP